jgi:hypothetical protein
MSAVQPPDFSGLDVDYLDRIGGEIHFGPNFGLTVQCKLALPSLLREHFGAGIAHWAEPTDHTDHYVLRYSLSEIVETDSTADPVAARRKAVDKIAAAFKPRYAGAANAGVWIGRDDGIHRTTNCQLAFLDDSATPALAEDLRQCKLPGVDRYVEVGRRGSSPATALSFGLRYPTRRPDVLIGFLEQAAAKINVLLLNQTIPGPNFLIDLGEEIYRLSGSYDSQLDQRIADGLLTPQEAVAILLGDADPMLLEAAGIPADDYAPAHA